MSGGPGSIRRLPADGVGNSPEGHYRARIKILGEVKSKTLPKKGDCETWLKAMRVRKIRAEALGQDPDGRNERITLGELAPLLSTWWKSGARRVHTKAVMIHYEHQLKQVLAYWDPGATVDEDGKGHGSCRVMSLTTNTVDEYVRHLRASGLSTSTIRHRLDRLAQLCAHAVRRGDIASLPCRIERPRLVLCSRPQAMPEEQLAELVAAAGRLADPRPGLVVLLAADAGLRREEILRLRGPDVSLAASGEALGWLHVAVRGEADRTKSGRGRDVPIETARLKTALESVRFRRDERVVRGIKTVDGVSWLAGKAWTEAFGEVERLPSGSQRRRKVRARLHDLRRRFGTVLANAGVPLIRIQAWMGHSSIVTTQRYLTADVTPTAAARLALEPQVVDTTRNVS